MRQVIAVCVSVFILSGCAAGAAQPTPTAAPAAAFTPGAEVTVMGTVTGTVDDCAFDGICALVLDVGGSQINAIWAEGMIPCQGQYDSTIVVGDQVEAFGAAQDAASLSICASPDYYIRR